MNERLITIKEVEKIIGFKKDFIYRNIKKNKFPKQVNLDRSARWRLSEVQKWVEKQTESDSAT
ncbi:helix-turn-helix transcriptional regulator [Moraxella bovis]|uniref:AlpA family phage regulatory protein n=1 Tax=Moraxella bovis TaxID=476 RepID=A0A2Z4R7J6_MORBO|nr:AlpA family phage regulatory protein [Moraxella bovis]AWY20312.1 AlpA family transcriptional regulator [Moraxella bovis]UYZ74551.1 AlpA family phage regulatory protein [Moraxella bovis]UYZ79524.1 AlpA family phage regulatory protein [Moraxella bovis]UYZ79878.1 AlpA family phage regulatory protein [Moraxella bovis]UYZ88005.1 AlpA family phage regulatory protein [Moraxella bovis]